MAQQIRRFGPWILALGVIVALAVVLVPGPEYSHAANYADPYWDNDSTSQECGACSGCGCPRPAEWSPEGVSYRTGELVWDHHVLSFPGVLGNFSISLRWRSMINGTTQLGNSVLPSWETTAEYIEIDSIDPDSDGGHKVLVRRPTGRIDEFTWNGTAYDSDSCAITDDLTTDGGTGDYILTDKYGNEIQFDSNGMPDIYEDRNGNQIDLDYNGSLELTEITDTRGKTYTITTDAGGYITDIEDPAGRAWEFTYDANDNLSTITTPGSADQPSGIETTFNYDLSDRLTSVEDGNGNTVYEFDWVGSTRQVDDVTIDTDSVDFAYFTGRTERTDEAGYVHRHHHTGQNITQTDIYIASTAEFVNTYAYNGHLMTHHVKPRGNRVDYTWDGDDNLTERRHRTANTSTDHATDLLHEWEYTSNFKTEYTDPRGNVWDYGRDSSGNKTSVTHPTVTSPATQAASESWTFNSLGQVTKHTDEEGVETRYAYFTTGASIYWLEEIEVGPALDPLISEITYDTAGNVATREDPNGNVWTFTHDDLRRLTSTESPSALGYEVTHEYDANGNRTETEVENVDKDGTRVTANPWFTTTRTFTDKDELLTLVEEIDSSTTRTTTIAYNERRGERLRVTKPEGNKEKWLYDARGLVTKHILGEGATEEADIEYAYDDNGNLDTLTDGRGNDTEYVYDLFDRRTSVEDQLGHYLVTAYDKNGNVTQVCRKSSTFTVLQVEDYSVDKRNRRWKVEAQRDDPTAATLSDAVTTTTYRKNGQVAEVEDARGFTTTNTYDDYNRLEEVEDAEGNIATNTYDDNGNRTAWDIEETDGTTTVTHEYEATYDAMNRMLTSVEIDRTNGSNTLTTTYAYDSRSNRVWQVDAEGNPTRWTFDGVGRMIKRERALTYGTPIETFTAAQVTEWGFDKNDRLTSHTDDGANDSTWDYDALDRATEMVYPDLEEVLYEYDDNSNVTKTTDPNGSVITDTFDDRNQMTSRSITRGTGILGTTSETYTYDALGRPLTAADNDSKVTRDYAEFGLGSRVHSETQENVGTTAYGRTIEYGYDAAGNVTSEDYPSGLDLDRSYDDIGNLDTITDGTNTIVDYTWQGRRMLDATFENGATQTNSFTGYRSEVSQIHHETSGSATVVQLDYTYDGNHDRLQELTASSGAQGDVYEYDGLRRLKTAWMGSHTPSSPSTGQYVSKIAYNMDDDGNRTSVVVTPYGAGAATSNYTTNSNNQYTAVGGTSRTHDDNGNLDDDGTHTYQYDYRNQIVAVDLKSTSSQIVEYQYDAFGRRTHKFITSEPGQRFIYSGLETIEREDASGNWEQRFVFGQGIDQIVMLEQEDILDHDSDANTTELTRSYYHTSALGSVMEITDALEATVQTLRYNPYGATTITISGTVQSEDPLGQPWGYTARFSDEETGLYYYRARAYDPERGRFLQRDPLGYEPGANAYAYVHSSPAGLRDPLGLEGCGDSATQSECKVCCELDLHGKLRAAKSTFEAALESCFAQHPTSSGASFYSSQNAAAAALKGMEAVLDVAGKLRIGGKSMPRLLKKALKGTLGLAEDVVEAVQSMVGVLGQWHRRLDAALAAGKGSAKSPYEKCAEKASSAYGSALDTAAAEHFTCLNSCKDLPGPDGYVLTGWLKSLRWVSGHAGRGKEIHPYGDEAFDDNQFDDDDDRPDCDD